MQLKGLEINRGSLTIEGVDSKDYPDFCDAFFSYGEFQDGRHLTDSELETLNDDYPETVSEMAFESMLD